jgi:hypothetical protein
MRATSCFDCNQAGRLVGQEWQQLFARQLPKDHPSCTALAMQKENRFVVSMPSSGWGIAVLRERILGGSERPATLYREESGRVHPITYVTGTDNTGFGAPGDPGDESAGRGSSQARRCFPERLSSSMDF